MSATDAGGKQGETPDRRAIPTPAVEGDIRRYRRWRARRRETERFRAQQQRFSKEVEDILTFARTWAPFGGPPEEEIFIKFGMPTERFVHIVRRIIREIDCAAAEEDQLIRAYSLPKRS